jgi:hypothetical protein
MKTLLLMTTLIFVSCGSGSSTPTEDQIRKNADLSGQVSLILNNIFISSAHAQIAARMAGGGVGGLGGGGRAFLDPVDLFTTQILKQGIFESYTDATLSDLLDSSLSNFDAIKIRMADQENEFYYDVSRVVNNKELAIQNGFTVLIGFNSSRKIESFNVIPLTADRKFSEVEVLEP